MICRLRGLWETITLPAFWRSLLVGPLVIVSGHEWPWPPAWSAPAPSPDPDYWPGLVEYDDSVCERCGAVDVPLSWRRSWRVQ